MRFPLSQSPHSWRNLSKIFDSPPSFSLYEFVVKRRLSFSLNLRLSYLVLSTIYYRDFILSRYPLLFFLKLDIFFLLESKKAVGKFNNWNMKKFGIFNSNFYYLQIV